MERTIIQTEDGSSTLKLLQFDEQYHSIHGAISESLHIYIHSGLEMCNLKPQMRILEVGLGTGLNLLLTALSRKLDMTEYWGVELYPLTKEEANSLNYLKCLSSFYLPQEEQLLSTLFYNIHACADQEYVMLTPNFQFQKYLLPIEELELPNHYFDLIYFDAFSPNTQPELWSEKMFQKMYNCMGDESILITYCAKGAVKRAMKAAGFKVNSLPGPTGKREITQCFKNY